MLLFLSSLLCESVALVSSMIWNVIHFHPYPTLMHGYGMYFLGFYEQEASQYHTLLHYLYISQVHP